MHIDPQALAASLDGIGRGEIGAIPLDEAIARVVGAAQDLFAVAGVGLMLSDGSGSQRYVLGTDEPAAALERAQEALGEGPCVDCFVLGEPSWTDDLQHDDRWPRLRHEMRGRGVRAVLGLPTRVGGLPVGSLNVYRGSSFDWDDSDVDAVERYNAVVESVLAGAVAARTGDRVARQLQEALDRRVVIERAVGLLMSRHGIDAVGAFNLLRGAARDARRPVADVAGQVLAAGGLPGSGRAEASGG